MMQLMDMGKKGAFAKVIPPIQFFRGVKLQWVLDS